MAGAGRNRKTVLNCRPEIRLQEKGYPGNRFFPIDKKWVYVLGNAMQLVDELYLTRRCWYRIKRALRGQRRDATAKTSVRLRPGRYVPPSPTLYQGELFFYLSPIPLGQQAIDLLCKWSKEERRDRVLVEEEFIKLAGLARSWAKKKGPDHAHRILWGHGNFSLLGLASFATVRVAVSFDAEGNPLKPAAAITRTPPWVHVVLLQDPEAWAEEIHECGVRHALELYRRYQEDPQHRKMRFIAHQIASEITANPGKGLEDRLLELPWSHETRPEETSKVAEELCGRLGWKVPTVERVVETFARGGGQPPVKLSHTVTVNNDDWINACNRDRSPNAAALYLMLDDLRATAYLQNVERYVAELESFTNTLLHKVMCAEHCYATVDAADEIAGGQATDGALRSSVRGSVHWSRLLSDLALCHGGRELIRKLSRANPTDKKKAHYFTLIRAGFEGSRTFFAKKWWDNTAKRAIKSFNLFVQSTLAGLLDEGFHAKVESKGVNPVYAYFNRAYARALRLKPAEGTGPPGSVWSEDQVKAAARRFANDLKKGNVAGGQHESYLMQERAKIYGKSYSRIYPTVDALLGLVDGLAAVHKLLFNARAGKKADASSVREVVRVAEAAFKTFNLLAPKSPEAPRDPLPSLLPPGPKPKPPALSGKEKVFLVGKVAGRWVGIIGAYLDVSLALDKVYQARNPGLAAGHLCQAVGAGAALSGSLWAAASGVAISGPVGWALAGAYLVGYFVGHILIWHFSFKSWKNATASSFLGRDRDKANALTDLDKQHRTWLALYSAYEVELDQEMHVTIKPGALAAGDRFVCSLSGRKWREFQSLPIDDFELVIKGARTLALEGARRTTVKKHSVGRAGWVNKIELKADVDPKPLERVTLAIKLHSKTRGFVIPPGDKLEVTLRFRPRPRSRAEFLKVSRIADIEE